MLVTFVSALGRQVEGQFRAGVGAWVVGEQILGQLRLHETLPLKHIKNIFETVDNNDTNRFMNSYLFRLTIPYPKFLDWSVLRFLLSLWWMGWMLVFTLCYIPCTQCLKCSFSSFPRSIT